jgi:HK97 gp10 family phage protein
MTNFQIQGLDELQRVLKDLPFVVSKRLVFSALRKGAKPMKEEAVNLAPRKSGTIKRAMVIVNNQYEDLPGIMISVTKGKKYHSKGEGNKDAWYARFQEFGTKGFGKRTRRIKSTSLNFKSGTVHRKYNTIGYKGKGTGLPARAFMQRAFDSKHEQAMAIFKEELGINIVRYLNKNLPHYHVN